MTLTSQVRAGVQTFTGAACSGVRVQSEQVLQFLTVFTPTWPWRPTQMVQGSGQSSPLGSWFDLTIIRTSDPSLGDVDVVQLFYQHLYVIKLNQID